ncbi:outer membrane protein assembly factor BamB family protein [Haladaptatus caseinilyticus]|uniref:outer membrane protein assembly factor BamB family protein n=1 Tax=Haladaptatus caseinilyticus TaxID=2993314 RepID=UPI00224AC91E|nr:PQQ-binding-like beta-propeller repeat protein [Haladaptatus caseinilyticus]
MDRGFHRREFLRATGAGLLALGSGCNTLRANLRWSIELDGSPARAVDVSNDGFVVASTLVADGELGFAHFSGEYESLADFPRITASPINHGNRAFVEADGVVRSVPLNGGEPTRLRTEYLAFGRYSPLISDSRLYGVGYSERIEKYGAFSLNLETERLEWLHPFGHTRSSVDTDGKRLFAASPTGTVRAYNAADGRTEWRQETAGNAVLTHHDGTVFVASMDGVTALSPTDGTVRWHTESDWIGSVGTIPEANDSTVYAVLSLYSNHARSRLAMETYVVAYNRTTGEERWRKRARFGTPLTATKNVVAFESVERAETSDGEMKPRDRLSIFGVGGGRKQQYDLSERVTMKPILRDGVVIFSDGNTIVAHDR